MRLRDAIGEGLREVASRNGRPLLLLVAVASVTAVLVASELLGTAAVHDAYRRFVDAGGATRVVDAPHEVEGEQCERLARADAISHAGAMRAVRPLRLTVLPAVDVPAYEVTPGFAALVAGGSQRASDGVLLSSALAGDLGVQAGGRLDTGSGPARVAGVFEYPDDGRAAGLAWAALLVVPASGAFDQCWARVPSIDERLAMIPLAAVTATGAADARVSPLNATLGATFDVRERLDARPTRAAPVAAFLACLALLCGALALRRVELASALHAGVRRRALVVRTVTECALVAIPAVAAVAAVAWGIVAGAFPEDAPARVAPAAKVVGGALLGSFAGAVFGAVRADEKELYRRHRDRA